jgi:tRNA(Arg) A34 adenosine deaminase TadA
MVLFLTKMEYMELALAVAREAIPKNEVPVACVFVDTSTGEVIGSAHNETTATKNVWGKSYVGNKTLRGCSN